MFVRMPQFNFYCHDMSIKYTRIYNGALSKITFSGYHANGHRNLTVKFGRLQRWEIDASCLIEMSKMLV